VCQDVDEGGIRHQVARETIDERGKPRHGRGEDPTAGFQESISVPQGCESIASLREVIEGSEEQDGVRALVRSVDVPGIADRAARDGAIGLAGRGSPRLVNMMLHRIEEMNLVTPLREPRGMHAGGTANIAYRRGRLRQMSLEDIPGAISLQLANTAG
jgi:hypothetical protein